MFCTGCGTQIPDVSRYCFRCGKTISAMHDVALSPASSVDSAVASVVPTTSAVRPNLEQLREENPALIGIGGWLFWFCIAVTIIGPLMILAEAFGTESLLVKLIDYPLFAFSIFTGITLWREQTSALRYVAIFLAIQFCLGALALIGSAIDSNSSSNQTDITAGLRAVIGSFIWFLYFHKSKRVLVTFGRNL